MKFSTIPMRAPALVLACALCAACAALQEYGMETSALVGGPLAAATAAHGQPAFRYVDRAGDTGTEYVGYRLATTGTSGDDDRRLRCSVIYSVRDETIAEARLAGNRCHESSGAAHVNTRAEQVDGMGIAEVVTLLGTPDSHTLADGEGTMVYDYGSFTVSSGGPIGGGFGLSIGGTLSCRMTIEFLEERVVSATTEGCFGLGWRQ